MGLYRSDSDLEFLKNCGNEDLDVLVTYLSKGSNHENRWAEELTECAAYKQHFPDHKKYWQEVAAEIQTFGGNSIANLMRGGRGIMYKEVLVDVCKKMKVNFNAASSVDVIEMNILMKVLTDSLAKMTQEQLREVVATTGIRTTDLTPQAVTIALQTAVRLSGFGAYKVALIVANAVARAVIGRGLSLAVNATLSRIIGLFSGPIGWVITGLWTIVDLAGPAYRVTIPSVIQVAYMRAKLGASSSEVLKQRKAKRPKERQKERRRERRPRNRGSRKPMVL